MLTVPDRRPKYCLFKPRGLAYVRIHRRVVYLGKNGSPESWEEYGRLLAELAAAPTVQPPPAKPGRALTVVELCAAYLDWAEGYYVKDGRPTDQMDTVRRALRVTNELYGHTPAAGFGPRALRAIQEHPVTSRGVDRRTPACSSAAAIGADERGHGRGLGG
jgi:hypothetical protein